VEEQRVEEQRRHQRIRFTTPPPVRIGQFGVSGSGICGSGELESVSLGGLTLRSELQLRVGEAVGCEFVLFDSPLIDLSALVVSRIGTCHGVRFQVGPVSECLLADAISRGLATGKASILSINDVRGGKVMRIAGGLNGGLRLDFMHGLARTGVGQLDLSAVTQIDGEGLELCRIAVEQYRAVIFRPSPGVRAVLPGRLILACRDEIEPSEVVND
jgi:hypothetical protein